MLVSDLLELGVWFLGPLKSSQFMVLIGDGPRLSGGIILLALVKQNNDILSSGVTRDNASTITGRQC